MIEKCTESPFSLPLPRLLLWVRLSPLPRPASQWEIGPIIRGRDYSRGMALRPEQARAGPSFIIPGPNAANGHVHYVTLPTRPLKGASRITLTYRIDAPPETRFVPQESPQLQATLSLYFQRAGDSWTLRQPDWPLVRAHQSRRTACARHTHGFDRAGRRLDRDDRSIGALQSARVCRSASGYRACRVRVRIRGRAAATAFTPPRLRVSPSSISVSSDKRQRL